MFRMSARSLSSCCSVLGRSWSSVATRPRPFSPGKKMVSNALGHGNPVNSSIGARLASDGTGEWLTLDCTRGNR
ncbi:hypothetical protein PF005_g33762 [Phytophthora fragariae]|uniref:Uncharacterized protein n=1 Tax=Phytophthora fragariae TaxID=53985 RepID=A0A6A3DED8_9STRA|nr:hypothetical protein PF009_g32790 [Phytophthora fragariae]KAE9054371.1 hypothetical protein PF010_g32558 [Phytophthora fragariae]KAE9142744.1 hypothetical protein PF005_g33762 [Phytophthora fragariae]KAE9159126.1 hypothetical protein PF002_g32936 [Phytophthora fragariae]